jgi:hypothetical protein
MVAGNSQRRDTCTQASSAPASTLWCLLLQLQPHTWCLLLAAALQIARLLLYKEFWYGTSDSTSSSSSGGSRRLQLLPSHNFEVPCTQQPRPQPASLAGTWNVFVIAANPAVEENPNTLQVRDD